VEARDNGHIQSYWELLAVLATLLLLTAATVTIARMNLGGWRIWTALGIASVKAGLVLLYFMHIRKGGRLIAVTFSVTIITLAILIGFLFWDVAYR
jgi:cytochrome c oxidase subunit 4